MSWSAAHMVAPQGNRKYSTFLIQSALNMATATTGNNLENLNHAD
ncbi:MAG: hypothetical protein OEV66_04140 [Spirochaetia bacterium]|nr:hypothetical protein [Spirochaetia bacterium]